MGKTTVTSDERGRKHVPEPCSIPCPIERGMRILGGKWTGSILWHLQDGPVRFNDLARVIAGASKKMIAERLRTLEDHGLISRTVRPEAPVAVEYRITPQGQGALKALDALRLWTETLPDAAAAAEPSDPARAPAL